MDFIRHGATGTCPHCQKSVHYMKAQTSHCLVLVAHVSDQPLLSVHTYVTAALCPSCRGLVLDLVELRQPFIASMLPPAEVLLGDATKVSRIYPTNTPRAPAPPEVPDAIRADYFEAAKIETLSPRATAMMLRRVLQCVLRDSGFSAPSLAAEIELFKKSDRCSSVVRDKLHIVREVGNYSAHPVRAPGDEGSEGDLLHVEPGELDLLFESPRRGGQSQAPPEGQEARSRTRKRLGPEAIRAALPRAAAVQLSDSSALVEGRRA